MKSNADSKGVRLEAPLLVEVEVNKTLLRGCENPPESPTNRSKEKSNPGIRIFRIL